MILFQLREAVNVLINEYIMQGLVLVESLLINLYKIIEYIEYNKYPEDEIDYYEAENDIISA